MVGTRSGSQALTPGLNMDTPARAGKRSPGAAKRWTHAPTTLTLVWMAVSLPLIAWDVGYVLGRPATMPGGWAHAPLWIPYDLYGRVDHMYGFKQWNLRNGFTAAQSWMNVVESIFYLAYLAIWYRGATGVNETERRRIAGRTAAFAVLLGFAASVMTVSKTVLYWLNEASSGFNNIGHNTPWDLVILWIIPNGAWLILPSFMIYSLGSDIIDAITIASKAPGSSKDD